MNILVEYLQAIKDTVDARLLLISVYSMLSCSAVAMPCLSILQCIIQVEADFSAKLVTVIEPYTGLLAFVIELILLVNVFIYDFILTTTSKQGNSSHQTRHVG